MTCADLTGSTTRYRIFDTRSVSYERAQGSPAQLRLFLALGISAAVSIFGLVEAALIKPLPCRDQTRLVAAFESSPSNPRCSLAYLDFIDWKSLNSVFGSLDAYALNGGFTLSTGAGDWHACERRVLPHSRASFPRSAAIFARMKTPQPQPKR